jgi:hypothetical protein
MAKKDTKQHERKPDKKADEKGVYFKQADFPQNSLQQAQKIASALVDNFAGKSGSPPDVALGIGISPTSSAWRTLTGSSIAYGLTEGGVNAGAISLTALGRRLVAPEEEGEDLAARRQAILKPRIAKEFFERYRRAKFPTDVIAGNVLKSLGVPPERVEAALDIVRTNGRYAGIIRETPTGPFINLDSPGVPEPTATPALPDLDADDTAVDQVAKRIRGGARGQALAACAGRPPGVPGFRFQGKSRVYLAWQAKGNRHPDQGTVGVWQL